MKGKERALKSLRNFLWRRHQSAAKNGSKDSPQKATESDVNTIMRIENDAFDKEEEEEQEDGLACLYTPDEKATYFPPEKVTYLF